MTEPREETREGFDTGNAETIAGDAVRPSSRESALPLSTGAAPESIAPGGRFGRYTIVAPLGAGGMGEVFRAFDPSLHRFVALKLLRADQPGHLSRFLREARVQARVDHPNVCKVHEAGDEGGRPYIAMQLVEGLPLGQAAATMSLPEKVATMRVVAEAVHAAHRIGLIHRDVKPANVLVARDEEGRLHPWVLDFGLAKEGAAPGLTISGLVVGTPVYMAPEQARGEEVDVRGDVYGLGATLFEVLCGAPPFEGTSAFDVLQKVINGEVRSPRSVLPDLPVDLETILLKCLETDPSRRYATARAVSEDLARLLDGEPISARPASLSYRLGRKARKHRLLVAVSLLGLAAALAGGGLALLARWQAYEMAQVARRLGEEVREVETDLRFARMLPLHDIRPARHAARLKVSGMQERLGRTAGEPAGLYLLGRALLALGDLEGARDALGRAASGRLRDPGLDLALGRTLAELYLRRSEEAVRSREKSEARFAELARTLRDPALAHLRAAGVGEREAALAQGLIALHEKRWDEAAQLAARAGERTPWLWEARALAGDSFLARGGEKERAGDADGALADFARAGEAFESASETGRSDASLWVRDATRWTRVMDVEHLRGRPVDAAYRKAREACARARAVDPDDPVPDEVEAMASWRRGENGMGSGEDPRPLYDQAVALGEAAARKGGATGWTQVGTAWHGRAMYEAQRGLDPIPSLAKADEAYARAIQASPGAPTVRSNAGFALVVRAEHELNAGRDPTPYLERAVRLEEEALRLDPRLFTAANSLGWALQKSGEWEKLKGRDPRALLARAEAALRRAVEINPKFAYGFVNLGNVLYVRGGWERLSGLDARPSLEAAIGCYRTARELAPGHAVSNVTLGFAAHEMALSALDRGESPEAALAEGRDALRKALEANPGFALADMKLGEIETVAGRWEARQGRSPRAAYARAEEALSKARSALATVPGVWADVAELARWKAEAELSEGRDPGGEISRGLAAAAKALALETGSAEAHAARGALLLVGARAERRPGRRKEVASEALAALDRALSANPLLARELSPLASEARKMASPPGPGHPSRIRSLR